MYLVRIGYRTLNLEYLIEAVDSALGAPPSEAPPGKIRVAVYPGKSFDVGGEDAARLRLRLDDNLKPIPKGSQETRQRASPRVSRARVVSDAESKPTQE